MLAVNDPQNPLEPLPICVRSWALYPAYLDRIEALSGTPLDIIAMYPARPRDRAPDSPIHARRIPRCIAGCFPPSTILNLVLQSTHCAFPPTDSPANSAWNLYPAFLAKLEIGIGGRYWPLVVVLLSVEVQVVETVSRAKTLL